MKSLDQVEARTIVNAANTPGDATNTFIISAPGSYYFTGNITGATGKHGISIQSDDVTLDLNGFVLIGGGGGAFRGVNVPAAQKNFCVRNGTIRGWTDGGVRTDIATNTLAEKLRLSDNTGATGLFLGNGSARDCVASGNGTGFGVGNGAEVRDCTATGNGTGFFAADRTKLCNCISTINSGIGFDCTSYVTLIDCTSSRNASTGIRVDGSCLLSHCNASRNAVSGIVAYTGCTIVNCTAGLNLGAGIFVSLACTIQNCTAQSNTGAGVDINSRCHVLGNICDSNLYGVFANGSGNRIEGNSCTANSSYGVRSASSVNLIVRNSAHNNAPNFSFQAADAPGPVIDMTAGGTIATSSPWANFSY